MNDHRAQVLADLEALIRGAQDNRVAYTLASRYCQDPWGKPHGRDRGQFPCGRVQAAGRLLTD